MPCNVIRSGSEFVDRSFQAALRGFLDSEKSVLMLQAPTGAGKTRGFSNFYDYGLKSLIVLPNNVLIDQNFNDFSRLMPGVTVITGEKVSQKSKEWGQDKSQVVERLVLDGTIIFTNPTMLLFMLTNFYRRRMSRSDQIATLLLNGLWLVVMYEFHVYSRDQKYRLISLLVALRRRVKFVIASATLDSDLPDLIKSLIPENEILILEVKKEGKDLIRGPVDYDFHPGEVTEVINDHINEMKEGKWFFITDSIREGYQIEKQLTAGGIRGEDICKLNRFDLSRYQDRAAEIDRCFKHRIIIASNIVEQGYNPPHEFNNFVIDRGMYAHNFRQRAGRVGRSTEMKSRLLVCMKDASIIPRILEKIGNGVSVVEKVSEEIGEKRGSMKPEVVGVYAGFMLQFFTTDARKIISESLEKNASHKFRKGFDTFRKAHQFVSNIRKVVDDRNCHEAANFVRWFEEYTLTFRDFIGERSESQIFEHDQQGAEGKEPVQLTYDTIWICRNLNFKMEDNKFFMLGFREEKNNDFDVYVTGFPYVHEDNKTIKIGFDKLVRDPGKRMRNGLEPSFKSLSTCVEGDRESQECLKMIVTETFYLERLKLSTDLREALEGYR